MLFTGLLLPAAAQAQKPEVTEIKLIKGQLDGEPYTGGAYNTGDFIWLSVKFSQDVSRRNTAGDRPQITLIIGNQDRMADNLVITGDELRFGYKVLVQDNGPIKVKANSLADNGNTIYKHNGNVNNKADQADLTHEEVDLGQRVGPIPKVRGLATEEFDTALVVRWTAEDSPGGYLVRWRERQPGSSFIQSMTLGVTISSFTITGLANGTTYVVRVDKLDTNGNVIRGAQSAVAGTPEAGRSIPTVFFVASTYSVAEGNTVDVTVTLSANPERTVEIPLTTTDGTGVTAADYSLASSVTFNSGETSKTVTFTATDDSADESDETVTVGFGTLPAGVTAGSTATTVVTITDNDGNDGNDGTPPAVTVSFVAATYSVAEGNTVDVMVTLSANPERTVEIPLTTTDGTGVTAADYSLASSVTFNSGETSKTVTFTATDDSADESDETVTVGFGTLPAGVTAGSTSSTVVTITDDDDTPTTVFSVVGPESVKENVGTVVYTVTLSAEISEDATVQYATRDPASDPKAKAGLDYTAVMGTLTFTQRNWNTPQPVEVRILDDMIPESSEAFNFTLRTPVGAALSSSASEVSTSITDDEVKKEPTITAINILSYPGSDGTYGVGDTILVGVRFSLSSDVTGATPSATTLRLRIGAIDREAPYVSTFKQESYSVLYFRYTVQTGDSDSDGIAIPANPITLGGNQIQDVNTDMNAILDFASLPNQAGHKVGGSGSTEAVFSVIGPESVAEDAGTAIYTVSLSAQPAMDATVQYSFTDTSTFFGVDYTVESGTLTFTQDNWYKPQSVEVRIVDDTYREGDESFSIILSSATNASVGSAASLRTRITDNEPEGKSTITAIDILSHPGSDATYGAGDVIQVGVRFSLYTIPSDTTDTSLLANTKLRLSIGNNTREASFINLEPIDKERYTVLYFRYTVQADDTDNNGISIPPNPIILGGVEFWEVSTEKNPDMSHPGLSDQAGHKVDGSESADVEFSVVGPADVSEAAGTAIYTVSLSAQPAMDATVQYSFTDTSTAIGVDYTVESGTLTFTQDNWYKPQLVEVRIVDDTYREGDESFSIILSSATNASVGSAASLRTTIIDNELESTSMITAIDILSHPGSDATYGAGDVIQVGVRFSLYTTPSDTADTGLLANTKLRLSIGDNTREASFINLEPIDKDRYTVLYFRYTVQADDTDTDGISIPPDPINLGGVEFWEVSTEKNPDISYKGLPDQAGHKVAGGGSNAPPRAENVPPVSLLPLEITPKFSGLPTVGVVATLTGLVKGGQEPYRYVWTVADEPEGSAVTLTGANTAEPAFTPTRQGGYELRVTVTDADGATATATVSADADHPGAATGLTAKPAGSGALAVTWTAAARAPHGYRLRWRVRGPNDLNEGVVVHGTGHRLTGLTNGTKYVVRVDTINATADGLVRGTRVTTAGIPSANSDTLGVPTVAVHDAQADEGDSLAFRITLSEAVTHEVKVRWRTVAGTARAGVDYESDSGEVVFASSETEQTVMVRTIDDAHNDPGETFRLVLSDVRGAVFGDGEAVGTISNSDPLPGVWLAHFGRTVADQVLDGIAQRVETPRTPGTQGTLAGVAIGSGDAWSEEQLRYGITPLKFDNWNAAGLSLQNERTMTFSEVLAASRFTLTGARDQAGGSLALWGRGARSSFDAQPGTLNLDGSVTTAILGADYGDEVSLSGVALAWSDGEGSYRDSGQKPEMAVGSSGTVAASLGAVIPYTSVQAAERLGLWGAAGYGSGTMTLTPKTQTGVEAMQTEDPAMQADIDWRMAAVGLRGELLTSQEAQGVTLAVVSDALWAQTDSAKVEQGSLAASASDVTRLRLGLKGRWSVPLQQGGQFAPSFEAGVRHDGGDAGSGLGVELGGGLSWAVPRLGLAFELSGRTLLAHESDGRQEHGLAATLGYDINPGSAQGLSFTLGHTLGMRSEGGLEALFAPETLDTRRGTAAEGRWTAEAAYGLPVFGQYLASPTIEIGVGSASRDYSLGWRLSPAGTGAADIALGIKATRQERVAAEPEHGVRLQLNLRW